MPGGGGMCEFRIDIGTLARFPQFVNMGKMIIHTTNLFFFHLFGVDLGLIVTHENRLISVYPFNNKTKPLHVLSLDV